MSAPVDFDVIMARAATENIPVSSRLLPKSLTMHFRAIYGYARLVDNIGDEFGGDREAALDWVDSQLDALFGVTDGAESPQPESSSAAERLAAQGLGETHEVFVRLKVTVEKFGLEREPFAGILAANRLDQDKTRYADFDELVHYCSLSTNPVGHLGLAVLGYATPERLVLSNDLCTGLQLVEHLQDVGEDAAMGRIYLPTDDMARFDVNPEDLLQPKANANLRGLLAYEVKKTRTMIESGIPLVASLRGLARVAVAGFVSGGLSALDAIAASGFEVLSATRQASTRRRLRSFADVYFGSAQRRIAAA